MLRVARDILLVSAGIRCLLSSRGWLQSVGGRFVGILGFISSVRDTSYYSCILELVIGDCRPLISTVSGYDLV